MPSKAFNKFEKKLLIDVDRIIASHNTLSGGGKGKQRLGHITRSGVFMLCAAWELYIEEVAIEIANLLVDKSSKPSNLPQQVQKEISKHVREHKHDLKPLELAAEGWERVYVSHVIDVVSQLNTPKAGAIDALYKRLLGWQQPSENWTCGKGYINDFVGVRGDIAHRGSDANYVRIGKLIEYRDVIADTALEHDNCASNYISECANGGRPWRRRIP